MALLVFEIGMLILVTYIVFPPFSSDPFPLCGEWGGGLHGLVISSCRVDTGNQALAPVIYARSLGQCLWERLEGRVGTRSQPFSNGRATCSLLFIRGYMYVDFVHVQVTPVHF